MRISWKEGSEESSVSEEQYQERFWRRRLDGIGLNTVNKVFLAIEFKRTQDARSNCAEKAIEVAHKQYRSLLTGLQTVGRVKGWNVSSSKQNLFVGGTCRFIHVQSFNKNMKALGLTASKWDPDVFLSAQDYDTLEFACVLHTVLQAQIGNTSTPRW